MSDAVPDPSGRFAMVFELLRVSEDVEDVQSRARMVLCGRSRRSDTQEKAERRALKV